MPLTDRSTSKLGQSLVDGFAADRIVRVLSRIERTKQVDESDEPALTEGMELISRLAAGDPVLGRPNLQRRTLGRSAESTRRPMVLQEQISGDELRSIRETLQVLLRGEIPAEDDFAALQGFFLNMAKRILAESESLETRSTGSRRFVAWHPSPGGDETSFDPKSHVASLSSAT